MSCDFLHLLVASDFYQTVYQLLLTYNPSSIIDSLEEWRQLEEVPFEPCSREYGRFRFRETWRIKQYKMHV
jgi:hypothetical protein